MRALIYTILLAAYCCSAFAETQIYITHCREGGSAKTTIPQYADVRDDFVISNAEIYLESKENYELNKEVVQKIINNTTVITSPNNGSIHNLELNENIRLPVEWDTLRLKISQEKLVLEDDIPRIAITVKTSDDKNYNSNNYLINFANYVEPQKEIWRKSFNKQLIRKKSLVYLAKRFLGITNLDWIHSSDNNRIIVQGIINKPISSSSELIINLMPNVKIDHLNLSIDKDKDGTPDQILYFHELNIKNEKKINSNTVYIKFNELFKKYNLNDKVTNILEVFIFLNNNNIGITRKFGLISISLHEQENRNFTSNKHPELNIINPKIIKDNCSLTFNWSIQNVKDLKKIDAQQFIKNCIVKISGLQKRYYINKLEFLKKNKDVKKASIFKIPEQKLYRFCNSDNTLDIKKGSVVYGFFPLCIVKSQKMLVGDKIYQSNNYVNENIYLSGKDTNFQVNQTKNKILIYGWTSKKNIPVILKLNGGDDGRELSLISENLYVFNKKDNNSDNQYTLNSLKIEPFKEKILELRIVSEDKTQNLEGQFWSFTINLKTGTEFKITQNRNKNDEFWKNNHLQSIKGEMFVCATGVKNAVDIKISYKNKNKNNEVTVNILPRQLTKINLPENSTFIDMLFDEKKYKNIRNYEIVLVEILFKDINKIDNLTSLFWWEKNSLYYLEHINNEGEECSYFSDNAKYINPKNMIQFSNHKLTGEPRLYYDDDLRIETQFIDEVKKYNQFKYKIKSFDISGCKYIDPPALYCTAVKKNINDLIFNYLKPINVEEIRIDKWKSNEIGVWVDVDSTKIGKSFIKRLKALSPSTYFNIKKINLFVKGKCAN